MILVIGEILIDVFENYDRIGGAPFNFAFHLKKLGWPVRFLTRIGDDTYGKNILDWLEKHAFSLEDVQIDVAHPTGTVQVRLDDQGIPKFDIRKEVAYDYFDFTGVKPVQWPDVRMIYMGSLAQRTDQNCDNIQKLMHEKGRRTDVFFDINLRPPHVNTRAIDQSLGQTNILKLNEDELRLIQNHYHISEPEDKLTPWIMKRFDMNMVILTKGSAGSTIYTRDKAAIFPARQSIRVADTVGAGDAYAAIAAAGYLKGLPPEMIIEKASDFAAYICTLPGAIPDDMSIYEPMRRQLGGDAYA